MAKPKTGEFPPVSEKPRGKSGEVPQVSDKSRSAPGETPQAADKPRHKTGETAAQVFDPRVAHKVLLEGLDNIALSLADAPVARKVEVGSVLWDVDERIVEVLAKIKESLRVEAIQRLDGGFGNCTIDGDDLGEASVRVLEAALRVPRGKNIEDIKRALGPDFFGLFFEEVVTYKPRAEYEERVLAVENPLHKKILLGCIERVEQTPRVAFRRARATKKA